LEEKGGEEFKKRRKELLEEIYDIERERL